VLELVPKGSSHAAIVFMPSRFGIGFERKNVIALWPSEAILVNKDLGWIQQCSLQIIHASFRCLIYTGSLRPTVSRYHIDLIHCQAWLSWSSKCYGRQQRLAGKASRGKQYPGMRGIYI
jgi:hypothetical protein